MTDPGAPSGEHVTRLVHRTPEGERELLLVGTAHVSQKSVEEVRRVIRELRPDAVCVELDETRHQTLVDETRLRRVDLGAILRDGRAGLFLSSLLFSAFQKQLGDRVGVKPGAEMLAALDAAREVGATVVFADRDVQTTLRRCYAAMGPLDRLKVIAALSTLPFAAAEIDEAQIEQLKQREEIGDAMDAFARQIPSLKVPLIDERDRYLIASTRSAPGRRVVSVVGAAHVAGMAARVDEPVDLAALDARPEVPLGGRLSGFLLPAAAATVVVLAVLRLPPVLVPRVLGSLFFPPAVATALLVAIAGGAIATQLAAIALAPFALFAPSALLGRALARVQAAVRGPSPEDAGRLREDVLVPSRLRRNPFLVALLVGPFARLGRTLGGVIGVAWTALRLL